MSKYASRITYVTDLGEAATASDLPLYVTALTRLLEDDQDVTYIDVQEWNGKVEEYIEVSRGDAVEILKRHGETAYQTMDPSVSN